MSSFAAEIPTDNTLRISDQQPCRKANGTPHTTHPIHLDLFANDSHTYIGLQLLFLPVIVGFLQH